MLLLVAAVRGTVHDGESAIFATYGNEVDGRCALLEAHHWAIQPLDDAVRGFGVVQELEVVLGTEEQVHRLPWLLGTEPGKSEYLRPDGEVKDGFPRANIPDLNGLILAGSSKEVFRGRVEAQPSDGVRVPHQHLVQVPVLRVDVRRKGRSIGETFSICFAHLYTIRKPGGAGRSSKPSY